MARSNQQAISRILAKMAKLIFDEANLVARKQWSSAYIDMRQSANWQSGISKFRVLQSDNSQIKVPVVPADYLVLAIYKLYPLTKDQRCDECYGMKMTVLKDAKYTVEYFYDPDCMKDPNFYGQNCEAHEVSQRILAAGEPGKQTSFERLPRGKVKKKHAEPGAAPGGRKRPKA